MKKIISLVMVFSLFCCHIDTETNKYHRKRDNIINVKGKINEIDIEEVFFSRVSCPHIVGNYIIIRDYFSEDKTIHIIDKNNFKYLASTAEKGGGPHEITSIGFIAPHKSDKSFYVTDLGRRKIYNFQIDSILTNENYFPTEHIEIERTIFPNIYYPVNDTLSLCILIEPTGDSGFNQSVGKWNPINGEIEFMKYKHPEIEKKRISLAVSLKDGIYVETYHHHDLVSICTFNGELKYNIYGKKWDNTTTNRYLYYGDVVICNDRIIAMYGEGKNQFQQANKTEYCTQFLVFDLEGNYISTLDTGYQIVNFCCDQDSNRLIIHMDDVIQYGYLDLNDII